MKIELYNNRGRLVGAISDVRIATRYRKPGFEHSAAFQAGHWDGYTYPIRGDGKFDLGNFEMVYKACENLGLDVQIDDYRRVAWEKISAILDRNLDRSMDEGLFEHQVDALDSCVKQFKSILLPMGIFDLATNAGKTKIITKLIGLSGLKTLVMLHSEQLLKDMVKALREEGLSVGIVTSSQTRLDYEYDCVVCMYKTALNKKSDRDMKFWLDTADAVIVDECHRAGAKNYLEFLSLVKTPVRWGFSGSAFDNANANEIRGFFGDTLISRENKDLIESGVSANVIVKMPSIPYPRMLDYEESFDTMKTYSSRNNMFLEHLEKGEKFIWCVEHHDHADHCTSLLKSKGYKVVNYDGRAKKLDRSLYIEQFNDGLIDGMVINAAGMEGLNLKNLKTIIYARGGKSLVWLKQFLGRGLRRKDDNSHVVLVDCYDDCRFLKPQAKVRLNYYYSQNFQVDL